MTFSIGAISFDKEYVFMLLMGHKERTNYDATSGYDYKNTPPTLLLAGTKTYTLLSGDKKVEIDMWPLVVDTKFVANQGKTSQLAPLEPVTVTNKPGVVFVPPTATRVEWKVVQGTNGANGFTNLFAAHKLFHKNGQFQMTTGGRTIVRGDGIDSGNPKIVEMGFSDINSTNSLEEVAVGVSTIYLNIDDYTNGLNRIGKLGSVNFELDYVPFGPDIWTETENGNKNVDNPIKKWIIRNGINSEPQDNNTIFIVPGQSKDNTPLTWGTSGANGNGAIRFKPAVGPGGGDNPDNPGWNIPGLDNLKITTGEYKGSSKINFTLAGIPEGKGQVYYKVASSKPTAISDYIYKDEYYNGLAENVSINPAPGTNDYIFLLLYKDGKIATKKIDTSAAPEIGTIIHTGD
jgi:hypothetical protein